MPVKEKTRRIRNSKQMSLIDEKINKLKNETGEFSSR